FEVDQGFLARRVGTEAHLQYVLEFGDAYDLAALAQERSVRGLLVRRFQDVLAAPQSDAERRTTLAALNLALRAMEGRKVGPDADR
ncbi:MAG: hypothetical protein QME94_11430, partial [Anaerolineae bacterium]|nr:hypothetical protein [Anaerolineae bacterium]